MNCYMFVWSCLKKITQLCEWGKCQISFNINCHLFEIFALIFWRLKIAFEKMLMQFYVVVPPGSMGKIRYICRDGQYML
jgi:hypothetical protein